MAKLPDLVEYKPSYNINVGDKCFIINNNQTKEIQSFEFGLRCTDSILPFVRSEGDRNLDDNPCYTGSKAIFLKPEFNRLIRFQRCLILADAFVVRIGNNKPHLVYLRYKQRPFAFAGVWDRIKDKTTGEEKYSFAIITTTANQLMYKLGSKRMPVILHIEYEISWLRNTSQLSDTLSMLNPYPTNLMNAYPIGYSICDKTQNEISLIQPIGKPVYNEPIYLPIKKPKHENSFPNLTLAERMGSNNGG